MSHRRRLRRIVVVLCVIWGACAAPTAQAAEGEEQVLFDFEYEPLSSAWAAQGDISVSREPLPAHLREGARAGHGVLVRAEPGGQLYTGRGQVPPDWSGYEAISMWVYPAPEDGNDPAASTLEVRLFEAEPYRSRLEALVEAFHGDGSTGVGSHLQPVLGVDAAEFERDWEHHVRGLYGNDE